MDKHHANFRGNGCFHYGCRWIRHYAKHPGSNERVYERNFTRRDYMRFHEHFLLGDILEASKEYESFKDCLEMVIRHTELGEFDLAEERSIDVLKSLEELNHLSRSKRSNDRLVRIANMMGVAGIDLDEIRRSLL